MFGQNAIGTTALGQPEEIATPYVTPVAAVAVFSWEPYACAEFVWSETPNVTVEII